MPDPLLFLKAMGAAAVASMLVVLATLAAGRRLGWTRLNLVWVLGSGVGLVAGYSALSLGLSWPPTNALDRFLEIVVPAALFIELVSGFPSVPRWIAWTMRMTLVLAIPRILLHASVYLSGSGSDPAQWQSTTDLLRYSALLTATWCLLSWLSVRSPGVSIPFALALSIQSAGLTIMLAGYVRGGAAAFPLFATLVGTTLAARLMLTRPTLPPIIGIGVVGLFAELFVGHFFGRLSNNSLMTILLAPLLCWITEIPVLRHRKPWQVGSIRLLAVAIPLLVILVLAKREFDREMGPLL